MKTRNATGAVLFLTILTACNKQRGPSLPETLSWMAQTYNAYEGGYGGHGSYLNKCIANCQDVGAQFSTRETLSFMDCRITHTTQSTRKSDHGLQETFSLGDIDPQSIRAVVGPSYGGVAEVEFSARNNAEALVYTGNIVGKGVRSAFAMDDLEYAGRFAEAFRHAVELCGGRPSTFSEYAAAPPDIPPKSVQELFKRLSSSVFVVETLDANRNIVAVGSGVALGPGEVITNQHVVEHGIAWRIRRGSESWPASIARYDSDHDLCALDSPGLNAPSIRVRFSSSLAIGERVYAIGAPEGLELTLSEGLISGLREYKGGRVIQTSAPISPGSSGGGLFDAEGRLVGVTTYFLKEGQNLNFALPGEWVQAIARP